MGVEQEVFKNRDQVVAEIKKCSLASNVVSSLSILFAAIGVIADLTDETLGLETINWYLVAIFAAILSVPPDVHVIMAKHLLGAEVIKKQEV